LGGILGPCLLLLGLRLARAGSVSLLLTLELVTTVLLGRFVFREHLSARGWIGAAGTLAAAVLLPAGEGPAALVAASLAFLFRERHGHVHRHDPLLHQHWHRHDDGHHDHGHRDAPAAEVHAHPHAHEGVEHEHAHWPDLHHRHEHEHDEDD